MGGFSDGIGGSAVGEAAGRESRRNVTAEPWELRDLTRRLRLEWLEDRSLLSVSTPLGPSASGGAGGGSSAAPVSPVSPVRAAPVPPPASCFHVSIRSRMRGRGHFLDVPADPA